jgi:hypothetical protein
MRLLGTNRQRYEDYFIKNIKETVVKVWNGFIWLRIGKTSGLLNTIISPRILFGTFLDLTDLLSAKEGCCTVQLLR